MQSLYMGNNDSLLYESGLQDGDEKYHDNLGKTETYFHLASTVSALIGGALAVISFRLVYVVSILPAIAMAITSFYFIEPARAVNTKKKALYHVAEALNFLRKNGKLRVITVASSLEFGVGHAMFGLQAAYVNTVWPVWALGVARALSGLFATISFWFSGQIIDRLKPLKTAFLSGVWSWGLSIIALIHTSLISPFLLTLTSLSFGSGTVAESTLLHDEFNSEQRATLGSITSLIGSLVFAVASIGVGYLADKFGPARGLLIGQIPLIIASLLFLKLRSKQVSISRG